MLLSVRIPVSATVGSVHQLGSFEVEVNVTRKDSEIIYVDLILTDGIRRSVAMFGEDGSSETLYAILRHRVLSYVDVTSGAP